MCKKLLQIKPLKRYIYQMQCVKIHAWWTGEWMNEWMLITEKVPIITNDELLNLVLWKTGIDMEKDAEA